VSFIPAVDRGCGEQQAAPINARDLSVGRGTVYTDASRRDEAHRDRSRVRNHLVWLSLKTVASLSYQ